MENALSCLAMLRSKICLFALIFSLANLAPATAQETFDFLENKPYRRNIPTPTEILGYEPGERHTNYRDQERVLLAIATLAKDRVKVFEYGVSVEGRPLRLFAITAPDRLLNLEKLRGQNLALADPRLQKTEASSTTTIKNSPAFVWLNHCIHGDESASFESAMWTFYTLAASDSPAIKEALSQSVVLLNPVFNPDGHERFAVWYNSIAVGSPESGAYEKRQPWAISGRFNHYRFDMNRDKLAQSQQETQMETAAFLHWMPQVFVDEHGQPENYFFPPNAPAVHYMTDPKRVEKWTDIFGRANGKAFDKNGWSYATRETFDFFYPGYLDTWTTLSGAIGMTYETDGGGNLARRRNDGTISTLNDAMSHHFTTAITTVLTAGKNREALLTDYLAYRKGAIEAGKTETMKRVVLMPSKDKDRFARLASLLLRVGIEVEEANAPFSSAKAHSYQSNLKGTSPQNFPVGSLIVDLSQPQGRLARAILEPDAEFDPNFVKEQLARKERNENKNERERKEDYEFYDITAWALPYAFDVQAFWLEELVKVETKPLKLDANSQVKLSHTPRMELPKQASVAYLIRDDSDAVGKVGVKLQAEGFRLEAVTKSTKIDGKIYQPGTLIARATRNPATLYKRLCDISKETGVSVEGVDSAYSDDSEIGLGSESIQTLRRPSIAVIEDDSVSQTSFGAVWHLLKQSGIVFTPIRLNGLRSSELDRFNVIIFPDGNYSSELGKAVYVKLKEWASSGGVLLGLGEGGNWLLDKDAGFSNATLVGSDEEDKDKDNSKDKVDEKSKEKLKNKKPVDLAGAIFQAKIDTSHFLGYGFERAEIAVPLGGSSFLKPTSKGTNVITFGKDNLRLSGFTWPGNTEKLLANSAYVVDEPVGSGHAILFLSDPTFRALWPGLNRLLINGILFGPGRNSRE